MTMQGPFTYRIEEAQVVRAMRRLMLGRMWRGPARWLLVAIAVLLILLIALEASFMGGVSRMTIAFLFAVPVALAIVYIWMAPMIARRQYRQSAALRAESNVRWDAESVYFDSERGHARLPFAEFHRWADTGEVLMLYQTEMYFNLVPRATLGEAADDLVAKLIAAGVKKA